MKKATTIVQVILFLGSLAALFFLFGFNHPGKALKEWVEFYNTNQLVAQGLLISVMVSMALMTGIAIWNTITGKEEEHGHTHGVGAILWHLFSHSIVPLTHYDQFKPLFSLSDYVKDADPRNKKEAKGLYGSLKSIFSGASGTFIFLLIPFITALLLKKVPALHLEENEELAYMAIYGAAGYAIYWIVNKWADAFNHPITAKGGSVLVICIFGKPILILRPTDGSEITLPFFTSVVQVKMEFETTYEMPEEIGLLMAPADDQNHRERHLLKGVKVVAHWEILNPILALNTGASKIRKKAIDITESAAGKIGKHSLANFSTQKEKTEKMVFQILRAKGGRVGNLRLSGLNILQPTGFEKVTI